MTRSAWDLFARKGLKRMLFRYSTADLDAFNLGSKRNYRNHIGASEKIGL